MLWKVRRVSKRWISSPNYTPGRRVPVDLIVVHCISVPAGVFSLENVLALFQNRLRPYLNGLDLKLLDLRVSAHYLIDRGGEVIQLVRTWDTAWHAGVSSFEGKERCNDFSIGVELIGDVYSPFTKEQYVSLASLCLELMDIYPRITLDRIVGHSQIAPERKDDPGPWFQWEEFRLSLDRGGWFGGWFGR